MSSPLLIGCDLTISPYVGCNLQISRKKATHDGFGESAAMGIVAQLLLVNLADREIAGGRMAEHQTTGGGMRVHGTTLCQRDAHLMQRK